MEEKVRGPSTSKNKKYKITIVIIAVIVVLTGGIFAEMAIMKNGIFTPKFPESGAIEEELLTQLKNDISENILLDIADDSTAVVLDDATIQNLKTDGTSGFFADAKPGDIMLLTYSTGRVILYRPSIHKLVNVGPIVDDAMQTTKEEMMKGEE
jgi:hypothetical protein